jgi:anti-sigma regulatory factor (Ser/Thr protein kinase)
VYKGNRERGSALSRQIVRANLRSLSRDRESVSFTALMDDPRTGEPEELEFHIAYLETDSGETEYICRAEKRRADRLLRSIDSESLQLTIDNYIISIDHVASRLTSALSKYMDSGSALMLKMGLQEILINAVEHGNLNISFDEKTRALEENRYLDFIRERQQDPRYRDRRVHIEYKLTPQAVQYRITDEGDGFDISDTMKRVDDTVEQEQLSHGRGIRMTRLLFDKLQYNSRGNQVLLVKTL